VSETHLLVVIGASGLAVTLVTALVIVKRCWHPVAQGQALIVSRMQGEPRVSFTGAIVLPIVQRVERVDLSLRRVEIDRRGKEGVICRDNIRADVKMTCFVRVNGTAEDIVMVARTIGCARAADPATLQELFSAKFAEAIKTIAKGLDFEELYSRRETFKDQIIAMIGRDLNGYVLDDAAIDYLEQTPLEALDPNNVLDAQGIKKILASSAGIDHPKRRGQPKDAPGALETRPTLQTELERLGLFDLQVTTEVSCDIAPERPSVAVQLDGKTDDALARLPSSVPRAVIGAIGRCELVCRDGRATLRWGQQHVTPEQLVAGARLVHALRQGDRAYR
jgi:hypothetical protein